MISAIAFGGKPLEILDRALSREFNLVTGPNILSEVRRNLLDKLGLKTKRVDQFLEDIVEVASVFVPAGKLNVVKSQADNLVLEIASLGQADFLVTGDKQHLLPLSTYEGIIIEPPSKFLDRLKSQAVT